MKIIHLYTSLFILFYVYLSMRTIRARRSAKVALGHNDNPELLKAMRAHSNFSEYVPLSLFAIYLIERDGANPYFIHLLALSLLIGRIIHAYGISMQNENFKFRVTGMLTTFTVLIVSALYLIYLSLMNYFVFKNNFYEIWP